MAILDDTRADWNARPPLRPRTVVPWGNRVGVSWHWIGPGKGPSASGPHQRCLDQVRDWQWQHQHKPAPDGPWKDLGYNALICQHARAIEGRGLEFSGSHSPGVNYEHVGVQFMVGDASGFPSGAMIARAVQLRADLGELGSNIRRDWAHRDDPAASTSCPGDAITHWVHSGGPTNQGDDMPDMAELKAELLTKADGAQLRKDIGWARDQNLAASQALQATVTAQAAAINALAVAKSVDVAEVTAAIKEAVEGLQVTLSVKNEVPA